MILARVHYRWLPSTAWANIKSILEDVFWYGPRNVIRWAPVIWLDDDFDWSDLADVMEYKLRRMSKVIGNGVTMDGPRHGRQMLICAELLKRLREDNYYQMGMSHDRAKIARDQARREQLLLGTLIGKYLRHWWD